MSNAALNLNSRFLTKLLTSGEEDTERMAVLKEDNSSTICELTMLILSVSIIVNMTCLTVTSFTTLADTFFFIFTSNFEVWW